MLSTYYIYYIVTTYYVINGINIFKYLHTDNVDWKGDSYILSTLCPLGNGHLYALTVRCNATPWRYTLLVRVMGWPCFNSHVSITRVLALGLRVCWCEPHSPFPPKKICVFWYADVLSVVSFLWWNLCPALVVGLFFVYTAQHGYGDAND